MIGTANPWNGRVTCPYYFTASKTSGDESSPAGAYDLKVFNGDLDTCTAAMRRCAKAGWNWLLRPARLTVGWNCLLCADKCVTLKNAAAIISFAIRYAAIIYGTACTVKERIHGKARLRDTRSTLPGRFMS